MNHIGFFNGKARVPLSNTNHEKYTEAEPWRKRAREPVRVSRPRFNRILSEEI